MVQMLLILGGIRVILYIYLKTLTQILTEYLLTDRGPDLDMWAGGSIEHFSSEKSILGC